MKRLILAAFCAAALTGSAAAVNATPGSQPFYVSTTLSDTVGSYADPTIYTIAGRTYFKLRDLGRLLDLGVTFAAAPSCVQNAPASPFVPEPGESGVIKNTATATAQASPTRQTLFLDGSRITPTAYIINGNNYIGLRDLGRLVDFSVIYNYDTHRITAYAAYPYAAETDWSAAMNDLANKRYAPVGTGERGAAWRTLVSERRAGRAAPVYAGSDGTLFRSSLYWADRITAALTESTVPTTPAYDSTLSAMADADLFDNPDRTALRRDFEAMSAA